MKEKIIDIIESTTIKDVYYDEDTENWIFTFANNAILTFSGIWRLLEGGYLSVTSLDHGHSFGASKTCNGVVALSCLMNTTIIKVALSELTNDIKIIFINDFVLELISTSAGYENWILQGQNKISLIGSGYNIFEQK